MDPGVQGSVESRESGCFSLWVCFLATGKASGKVFIRVLHLGEEASLVKYGMVFSFLLSDITACLGGPQVVLCTGGCSNLVSRGRSQGRSSHDSEHLGGLTGGSSACP